MTSAQSFIFLVSSFYIKDSDNLCDVNISSEGAAKFIVKESKFNKNITGNIVSDSCIRNNQEVPCQDVFVELNKTDYTIKIVMCIIGIFAFVSLSVIITRVPFWLEIHISRHMKNKHHLVVANHSICNAI